MDEVQIATYIAWEEYYRLLTSLYPNTRVPTGGPYANKRHKAFTRLGRYCVQERLDPCEYLRTAFPIVRATCSTILPHDFLKKHIRGQVRAARAAQINGTPAQQWEHQRALLRQTVWLNDGAEDVELLRTLALPFVKWFRVMYPQPYDPECMHVFGEAAWDELRDDQRLREFMRAQRPETFRALEMQIAGFGEHATQ